MKRVPSYQVAKGTQRRKMPTMRPLALILALATSSFAQTEGIKPPPPVPGEGPPHREGDRRGPPGMMPGMGKGPPRFDGFDKLSEAERQKVRTAFEKAWQRPEVIESRDKAMKANEEMREKLRDALKEIDPDVAAILEKVKPPFPTDQRGLPEMPNPDSPEFGSMAAMRLGAEILSVARPERREDTRRFHERLMQMPRIREGLAKLDQLPPGERIEAFKKLRDTYREIAGQEFKKLREKPEAKDGGFRRPPEQAK
jgi:hypothetical protein